MRENMGLYRGKRTDNGEWIYGSLLKIEIDGSTAWVIFGSEFQRDGKDVVSKVHAHVDPDTVGECTSLPDKNGKLIFEDDILSGAWNTKLVIYLDNDYLQFRAREVSSYARKNAIDYYNNGGLEIIGNIHDNPELLGGADK